MNGDITQQVPKQQQHKHNNFHSKQRQPAEQTVQERERRQREEDEKGQKEREKGVRGKKEKGREAEKEGDKEFKKDVTGWTVVTGSRKQRKKTVQIFVKVDGSKATPMEVSLTDDKVDDVTSQIPNGEDVYVTMHGRILKRSEKLDSCGVRDGCTIQVTNRMRGRGKRKDKKCKAEKKQVTSQK